MCQCGGADEHGHGRGPMPAHVKNLRPLVHSLTALNYRLSNDGHPLSQLLDNDEPKAGDAFWVESAVDDQLLVKVSFSGSVRLRALQLRLQDHTPPSRLRAFVNQNSLDFSSLSSIAQATQQWSLPQSNTSDLLEYPVKPFKFSNVSHLSLLFENERGPKSAVAYIGFTGELLGHRAIIQAEYEVRPQVADHRTTGGLFDVSQSPQNQ
jgi:hypothetical protein